MSTWTSVNAVVPQGSISGPFLFLIHINDISDKFSSNVKLFADDTSLFSVIHDIHEISDWAFQWKMVFSPDASKQAQEIIFSWKIKKLFIRSGFQQ